MAIAFGYTASAIVNFPFAGLSCIIILSNKQQADVRISADVGMNADIPLLSSDPLQDIRNTRVIRMVMHGGKIVNAKP